MPEETLNDTAKTLFNALCFTLKQSCFWKCQEGLECKRSFGIGQFNVYKCAQPEGAGPDLDNVDM